MNDDTSETRIFIGGNFFNDGTGTPGSGNSFGDIAAYLAFFKSLNSIEIPNGYMGVRGRVRQCTNEDCSEYNQLYETLFGNLLVKIGKKTIFRITVDKSSNTITFQVGKKVFDTYTYTVDDSVAAGNNNMRLEVTHDLANCTASKTVGWADVLFDYVSIALEQ